MRSVSYETSTLSQHDRSGALDGPCCRYGTETVSHEVLSRMKQQMVESSTNSASHSFLLDDDSTIPFSQDDIAAMLDDKVGLSSGQPFDGG